jgi:hypothetical protein
MRKMKIICIFAGQYKELLDMKKIGFVAIMLCLLFAACDKDTQYFTMEYPIAGDYTRLEVSSAFDVVVCDTVASAVVTTSARMQQYVVVKVEDGVLTIKLRPNLVISRRGAKVLLPRNEQLCEVDLSGSSTFVGDLMGENVELDISGSSDFEGTVRATQVEMDLSGASSFTGSINSEKVAMDLSGSSEMTGRIDATTIELEAIGSSTVKAEGSCLDLLDLDLSGSSEFLSPQMDCRKVTGELSGSSDADFNVCESLRVALSGSSHIVYGVPTGCTPTVNCSTSGSSSVNTRQ